MNVYPMLKETGAKNNRYYGVVVGIVTNNQDPEGLGRVKLKIPNLVAAGGSDLETDWARVASLFAGPQRGIFFLPEVNDEVLVAFNGGSILEPYVVGALWNTNDKPPVTGKDEYVGSDGKIKVYKVKTKQGHEFIFNDEAGKESITLKSKAGATIMLDDQNKKIEIKDSSGNNTMTIDTNGNAITVKANTKVELVVSGNKVTIEASGITIQSSGSLKLKGSTINIEASGPTTIKGAVVNIN
ncbi:MAG: phage tail protein [Firmicutes bacterium]|nr:phage tail protein [Bacillota bacterium]